MPETPMPLSPDDEPQQTVRLTDAPHQAPAPYGVVAIIVGMYILLALPAIPALQKWAILALVDLAVLGGLFSYIVLLATRPSVPWQALAVGTAIIALFFSLPASAVYGLFWHNVRTESVLVWLVGLTAIFGGWVGYWLQVKFRPLEVLSIIFISIFAITNLLLLAHGDLLVVYLKMLR